MQTDGLILMGGKSSRMDERPKEMLLFEGKTFALRLIEELRGKVNQLWISYGREIRGSYAGCKVVTDIYPDCGPIGGIHAGMKACDKDLLLVAACDMPMLTAELYEHLFGQMTYMEKKTGEHYDGVVPVAKEKIHPLAAIYKTHMVKILESQIKKGNYRLRDMLDMQNILFVDVSKMERLVKMLQNVNTAREYESLIEKR